MKGKINADIGYMLIPDAAQFIADKLGEKNENRNSNKYVLMVRQKLTKYNLGIRNYQVKVEDVENLVSHLLRNENNEMEISQKAKDGLKLLIELKEDGIINLEQFYEATKKLI